MVNSCRLKRSRKGDFSLRPPLPSAKYCLGLVQFSLGQIPEAQLSALDTIRLDPAQADGDVYVLLARIHERLNEPNAVVADVRTYYKRSRKRSLQAEAQTLLERATKSGSRLPCRQLNGASRVVRQKG